MVKISKYDASRDVYYDVELDGYVKELESLGLNEEEIAPKVEGALAQASEKIAKVLGVDIEKVTINEDLTVEVEKE